MRWTTGIVLALLAGCSGNKATGDTGQDTSTGTTPATGPATLNLSFDLDDGLIPQMSEPAAGTFKGSIYAEADASALGPNDGATSLVDFESDPLDFGTAGGTLAAGPAVGPIDSQIVWIVGCLDTTGDDCECGDPITVPNENKMQITPGTGEYTVKMSLLNPQGC